MMSMGLFLAGVFLLCAAVMLRPQVTWSEGVLVMVVVSAVIFGVFYMAMAAGVLDGFDLVARKLATLEALQNGGGRCSMSERVFDNLMQVLRALQDDGYKLKKSKLYKDKGLGLIRVGEDGSVTESEMLAYVTKAGLSKKVEVSSAELEENADRKFRAEIRKLEAQARASEFDLAVRQGKYMLIEDAVRSRIDQMQILEVHFRHVLETKLPEWITVCSGNQKRLNDLRDMAGLAVDEMMNGLARSDTFSVSYEMEEVEA